MEGHAREARIAELERVLTKAQEAVGEFVGDTDLIDVEESGICQIDLYAHVISNQRAVFEEIKTVLGRK